VIGPPREWVKIGVAADPLDLLDAYVSPSKQTSDTKSRSRSRSACEALQLIDFDALCKVASTFYPDNWRVNWILQNTGTGRVAYSIRSPLRYRHVLGRGPAFSSRQVSSHERQISSIRKRSNESYGEPRLRSTSCKAHMER